MMAIAAHSDSIEFLEARRKAFETIEQVFNSSVQEVLRKNNIDPVHMANSNAAFSFGSYMLQCSTKKSDVDIVCISSKFYERSDFEKNFSRNLS